MNQALILLLGSDKVTLIDKNCDLVLSTVFFGMANQTCFMESSTSALSFPQLCWPSRIFVGSETVSVKTLNTDCIHLNKPEGR